MTHAFLAPSSAHRWGPGGCPASPSMAVQFPQERDNEAAQEGTTGHWYASETLQGRNVEEGDVCPETGLPVTADLAELTERFIADCQSDMARFQYWIESVVAMPSIHEQNWGRLDFAWYSPPAQHVGIRDLKLGYRPVDAIGNWQAFDYLVGLIETAQLPVGPGWTFEIQIYQPRDYVTGQQVKCWNFTYETYLERHAQLQAAAHEASDPNAPARTGSHCKHCPAATGCKALQIAALEVVEHNPANPLNAAQAGQLLTVITRGMERLEALKDGLEAQVEAACRSGQNVPGWEMQPKTGRTVWNKPVQEVLALGDLFGVNLRKDDAITPKQAIKAGIDETVIAAYSHNPSAGVKLAPSDNGTRAARIFQEE